MKSMFFATFVFLSSPGLVGGCPDGPNSTIQYIDPSVLFGAKMTKLDKSIGPFTKEYGFNVTEAVAELFKMKPDIALYCPENRLLYVSGDPELVWSVDVVCSGGLDSNRVMTQIYQGSLELRMVFAGDPQANLLSCKIMFNPSNPAEIAWVDDEGRQSKVIIGPVYSSDDTRSVEGDLLVDAHVAGQAVRLKTVIRAARGQEQLVAAIPNAKGAKAPDILCFVKTDAGWNEYERKDETEAKREFLRSIDEAVRKSLAQPKSPERQTDNPSLPSAIPSSPDRTQESRPSLKPGASMKYPSPSVFAAMRWTRAFVRHHYKEPVFHRSQLPRDIRSTIPVRANTQTRHVNEARRRYNDVHRDANIRMRRPTYFDITESEAKAMEKARQKELEKQQKANRRKK